MNIIELKTKNFVRRIGLGHPVFIIAEISGNHNQDIKRAYEIIDAAANAGVDAVKLQTYTADTITLNSDLPWFQVKTGPWAGKNLYELYQSAYTPWEWQGELMKYAHSRGLICFSTPFDNTAVDFLESLDVPLYKVASFETGDLQLLEKIGKTKKPVIISRGMTSNEDLKLGIQTLKEAGCPTVAVLHCVSEYPAPLEDMNLATISELSKKFDVIAGLSDHSLGIIAAVTTVGLGAKIIEKHITLKRSDGGPDAAFSLEPDELVELVKQVRDSEKAIGVAVNDVIENEKTSVIFRRSLFVVNDIKAGETFTEANLRSIRPGNGLEPKHFKKVVGKIASRDIVKGTPLDWNMIKE